MRAVVALAACLFATASYAQTPETVPTPPATSAAANGISGKQFELRGLNKMTARTSKLTGPILVPIEFGNLEVVVKACWSSPPDKKPEHAALMEITDNKPGEGRKVVFAGWMFASSPALSALEHPVYDITVISCGEKKAPDGSKKDKKSDTKKKKKN